MFLGYNLRRRSIIMQFPYEAVRSHITEPLGTESRALARIPHWKLNFDLHGP